LALLLRHKSMLLETEILIGDIADLSPTQLATINDLDLEKCTVLELDKTNSIIKVVFNNDTRKNETFFDNESTIDWLYTEHIIAIERDYKVIEITDNQDTVTGQDVCIITMARIVKQVRQSNEGYQMIATADQLNTDKFVFIGFTAGQMQSLQGTTNRISFAHYKLFSMETDGMPVKYWKPKKSIEDPEDIFTMLDLKY
jgi:hypothetical protein